jgi:molecular chaperone GrpE
MSEQQTKNWKKFKEEQEREIESTEEASQEADTEAHESAALDSPDRAALEEKLTLAEQLAHENWEKSVRAIAELENVRRRAERDVSNAHRYGLEKFIASLLPVADSLEQALQQIDKDTNPAIAEGLQLTMKLFLDVLQKHDVVQLDPTGMIFNPQEHEAMSMVEQPDVAANTIVAVFQKGYRLNDRVVRPARVIVAKGTPVAR